MKMKHGLRAIAGGAFIAAGLGIAVVSASTAAMEHPGKTLYSFTGAPDGAYPNGDLIVDAMGVYYGTPVWAVSLLPIALKAAARSTNSSMARKV